MQNDKVVYVDFSFGRDDGEVRIAPLSEPIPADMYTSALFIRGKVIIINPNENIKRAIYANFPVHERDWLYAEVQRSELIYEIQLGGIWSLQTARALDHVTPFMPRIVAFVGTSRSGNILLRVLDGQYYSRDEIMRYIAQRHDFWEAEVAAPE